MDAIIADLFGKKRFGLDKKRLQASDFIAPKGGGRTLLQRLDFDIADDFGIGQDPEKAAYLRGSIEPFESKANLELPLTKDRNYQWIPGIMHHWKFDNVLVGVGCAHLLGEHSVLRLLQQQGFKIRRMRDGGSWADYLPYWSG